MPRVDPFTGHLVVYTATPGVLGADRIAIVELDAQWNERGRVERSLGVKGAVPHDLTPTCPLFTSERAHQKRGVVRGWTPMLQQKNIFTIY